MEKIIHGSCLCGHVRFKAFLDTANVGACHCKQCQKSSGNYWAAVTCDGDNITITNDQNSLKWYQSSSIARRGFCQNCGSFLFWADLAGKHCDISMGALDGDTKDLELKYHIWVDSKQAYYKIADGLPQYPQGES